MSVFYVCLFLRRETKFRSNFLNFELKWVFVTGKDSVRQPCRVLAHPGSALRRGFLLHAGTHTDTHILTSDLRSLCWPLTSLRTPSWLWRRWLSTAESSLEPSSVRTSTSATERRERWKQSNSARADLWPRPSRWDGDRCRVVRLSNRWNRFSGSAGLLNCISSSSSSSPLLGAR